MSNWTKKQLEDFTDFCLQGAMNARFETRDCFLIMLAACDYLNFGAFKITEEPDGTFTYKEGV